MASDLGLHCLPMSHKKGTMLIWVIAFAHELAHLIFEVTLFVCIYISKASRPLPNCFPSEDVLVNIRAQLSSRSDMYFWSGLLLSGVSWEGSAEARLSLHLPPIPYEIVLAYTCRRYLTRLS